MDCLFVSESDCCDKKKEEHLFNECVFGSLTSSRVLCRTCNEHFGKTIDRSFCRFFSLLSSLLAKVTVGWKDKSFHVRTEDGKLLGLKAGNLIRLKHKFVEREVGDSKEFVFRKDEEAFVRNTVLANRYPNASVQKTEYVGVQDAFGGNVYLDGNLNWKNVLRGVLLDVLEVQYYIEMNFPNVVEFVRGSGIRSFRQFVRKGKKSLCVPAFPIGGSYRKVSELFGGRKFSHTAVITSGPNTQSVCFIVSYFGLMPFVFRAKYTGVKETFTYAYQKDIISGGSQWRISDECLLEDIEFWGVDVVSESSLDFAEVKFKQSLEKVFGRANIYVDLNDDSQLEDLEREIQELNSEDFTERVKKAIMTRYGGHSQEQKVEKIVREECKKYSRSSFKEAYREVLKVVVEKVGYPTNMLIFKKAN